MSEKKGYWIAHVHVNDPERYKLYVSGAAPAFERYGAKFLVRGGEVSELEGALGRERNVVIEFASYRTALDCYHSDTYQEAMKHRQAASEGMLSIVEGA